MGPIVLDVNVIVSAILGPLGNSRKLLAAWRDGRFRVVTAEGIVVETEDKLRTPRIATKYRVSEKDVAWVRGLLLTQARVVVIQPGDIVGVTGDPEDDYVLATCRVGHAEYLVTGDHGLLARREHGRTRIVTPREFLAILSEETPPAI